MTSEEKLQADKDYLALLYTTRADMMVSGGAKKIRKGDFSVEYTSIDGIDNQIRVLTTSIYIQENGCPPRKGC